VLLIGCVKVSNRHHFESNVDLLEHISFEVVILTFIVYKWKQFYQGLNKEAVLVNEIRDFDEGLSELFVQSLLERKPNNETQLNTN